jgi:hypothetical protein
MRQISLALPLRTRFIRFIGEGRCVRVSALVFFDPVRRGFLLSHGKSVACGPPMPVYNRFQQAFYRLRRS